MITGHSVLRMDEKSFEFQLLLSYISLGMRNSMDTKEESKSLL